jgi:hypothetical protein
MVPNGVFSLCLATVRVWCAIAIASRFNPPDPDGNKTSLG